MTHKIVGKMMAIALIMAAIGFMVTRQPSSQADAGLEPLRDTLVDLATGIRGEATDTCGPTTQECRTEETSQ